MDFSGIVVALGGNALAPASEAGTIAEQFRHTRESLGAIIDLAADGGRIAIVHGNGPQVGNALTQQEIARNVVSPLPLGVLVAATEGWIGYMIQQSLENAFTAAGIDRQVVTLVTQVLVARDDPELLTPTKAIGRTMDAETANALAASRGRPQMEERRMWRRLWGAGDRERDAPEGNAPASGPAPSFDPAAPDAHGPPLDEVRAAYWLALWRGPSDHDLVESARALDAGQTVADFAHRFLVSTEFRLLYTAVKDGEDPNRPPGALEDALRRIGDRSQFVQRAYALLFGRPAEPDGHDFYVDALAAGTPRRQVLETFLRSDEFAQRYARLCPDAGFIPRDVQLCELANPAKWDNPDWVQLLTSLGEGPDKGSMHRKAYEFTQLLFGLDRLGALGDDVDVLSVGAGHEPVLYWLANHAGRVLATDMYGGVWQSERAMEGDAAVFADPAQFARFPYRRDRLVFLRMDGRHLAFAAGTFDVVYSLSSVEHFGGLAGAKSAIAEMARVLKPGGLLVLSTEYCLSGPPHHEAFQPAQVQALLEHPELALVEPIDERVWQRYDYVPIDLRVSPYQTPHMVVTDLGSVFTTVMAFLRKRS